MFMQNGNVNPMGAYNNPLQSVQNGNVNPMGAYNNPLQSVMSQSPQFLGGAINSMMMMPGVSGVPGVRPGQSFPQATSSLSSLVSSATNTNNLITRAGLSAMPPKPTVIQPGPMSVTSMATNMAQPNSVPQSSVAARLGVPATSVTTSTGTNNALTQTNMAAVQPTLTSMATGMAVPQTSMQSMAQIKVPTMASTLMNFGQGVMQPGLLTLNSPTATGGYTPGGNF